MRRGLVAVTLAGAIALSGALDGQEPSGAAPGRDANVTFESSAGHCGGMLAAHWIITARHCADALSSIFDKPDKIAVRVAGVRYEYEGAELSGLRDAAPPNAAGEALSLDFALLPAPVALIGRSPPPDPVPSSDLAGISVRFTGYEGRLKTCQVTSVCGAQIQIGCNGLNAPVEGDSGHPVFAARSGRAIGILTGNSSDGSGAITSYATIMGRSGALSSAWNETRNPPRHQCDLARPDGRYCALSREFARSSRYRYPLDDGSLCRRAAAVHPEVAHRRVKSERFFTAVAQLDAVTAVAADVRSGSLCTIRRSAVAVETCTKLPISFGRNVRTIVQLGSGQLLISQASTSKPPGGTGEWSRVAVVNRTAATGALSFTQPILVPLRQVTSAIRNEDGDLLVGGTGGICIVRRNACQTIVWHAENPGQSDWVARGLLRLGNGEVLAVGRDYRDDSAAGGPSRRRVEIARCWVLAPTPAGFNYRRSCNYPSNRLVEQLSQLISPVMIAGEPIAFSSSGEAVALTGGRIGRTIPFDGLMESSRPSAALDDVIRGVVDNEDGTLTVASSDGSVRVVQVGLQNGKLKRLTASDARTAFDLAIWIVGVASAKGWATAVAQSGEIYTLVWPAH